jgi:hypothetical protein
MQSPTPSPTLREGNLAVPVQVATTRFFIYRTRIDAYATELSKEGSAACEAAQISIVPQGVV